LVELILTKTIFNWHSWFECPSKEPHWIPQTPNWHSYFPLSLFLQHHHHISRFSLYQGINTPNGCQQNFFQTINFSAKMIKHVIQNKPLLLLYQWSCNQSTILPDVGNWEKWVLRNRAKLVSLLSTLSSLPDLQYQSKVYPNQPLKSHNFHRTKTTKVKTRKRALAKSLNLVKEKRLSEKLQGLELKDWHGGDPLLACECDEGRAKCVSATAPSLVCEWNRDSVVRFSIEKKKCTVFVRDKKWFWEERKKRERRRTYMEHTKAIPSTVLCSLFRARATRVCTCICFFFFFFKIQFWRIIFNRNISSF